MSLSTALNVAQSSLSATSMHTSILSRNVAGSSDANYHRKTALQVTSYGGAVRIASVSRAMDEVLFAGKLASTSSTAAQKSIVASLTQLETTVNDPELDQSLAAKIGKLSNALQEFSITPDDPILAQAVLNRAGSLAHSLNEASATVSAVREQADADMATGVSRVKTLLAEFETVNRGIVKGSQASTDITDQLDTRDRILRDLSQEIGISVQTRANNDMVIYTDSGVTLFETVPRTVSMAQSFSLSAGATANAVYVDGVAVTGANAVMPIRSGQIYGASVIRDNVAVTYQRQLDEIARGLVETFAESDQSTPPAAPAAAGLFIYGAGAPPLAIPPTGVAVPGLASSIRINPHADPAQGGDLDRLRDGAISDPTDPVFNYNPSGAAGFGGRIQELLAKLGTERNFDPASEADPTNSLSAFASSSVSWLEGRRQTADKALGYETALLDRTTEALSNATGVNVNDEMALMMELERSYNASSMILKTVDNMINALLAAVR
ncbi:MAG: flagellar hook-associated protein FlgK [Bosea sp.]|uniref:flagellar hook-associated protein FlgK n=1 Tax=Bosea sp. (in: a-proteobacteria) TaxID=1871050 RepID=UPI00239A60EA|nr:flagellar hook-associated protein FlgK [Bosea sp. (in: a-proteobacteria)]MCP4737773.1 flagellar hook-associated protein FlgK [Bosea sp. (in: a-proteobacteria)]